MPDFKLHAEPLPGTGQPVGLEVDTTPANCPAPTAIEGRYGRLEKLQDHHAVDLWSAVQGHDDLWTYMGDGPFDDADIFAEFIAKRAGLADPYAFAIIDGTGRAVGYFTLMEIRPEADPWDAALFRESLDAVMPAFRQKAVRLSFEA